MFMYYPMKEFFKECTERLNLSSFVIFKLSGSAGKVCAVLKYYFLGDLTCWLLTAQ